MHETDYQVWYVTHDENGIENVEVLTKAEFMKLLFLMMHDVFDELPLLARWFVPRRKIIRTLRKFFDAHIQLRLCRNLNKS